MKRNTTLIFLIAIALLPRLLLAIFPSAELNGDECTYNSLASSIVNGQGFSAEGKPFTLLAPLYPYFLALIYKLFGYSFTNVRLIQALIGSVACTLVYLISKKLFNQKCAAIAFLFTAFNPAIIKSCERIRSECLFMFLMLLVVLILIEVYKKNNAWFSIFLGMGTGLLALTRGMFILFPIFFIVSLILIKAKRGLIKSSLITILFFCLTLSPWTIRNWFALGSFIPLTTQSGLALYSSFNPKDGNLYGFDCKDEVTEEADKLESEVAKSRFLTSQALKTIKENPLELPRIELLKFLYFWCPFDWEIIKGGRYNLIYGFIFPLFLIGFIFNLKDIKRYLCLYLPIIYFQTITLIFYGSPRFRLPLEPILAIFAASTFLYFENSKHKRTLILALAGYALINVFIYFNAGAIRCFLKNILLALKIF